MPVKISALCRTFGARIKTYLWTSTVRNIFRRHHAHLSSLLWKPEQKAADAIQTIKYRAESEPELDWLNSNRAWSLWSSFGHAAIGISIQLVHRRGFGEDPIIFLHRGMAANALRAEIHALAHRASDSPFQRAYPQPPASAHFLESLNINST